MATVRSPRRIGDLKIDYAFTDLARDAKGRAWMRLTGPDGGVVGLWVDGSYRYLEVFTGDTLTPGRRRRGLRRRRGRTVAGQHLQGRGRRGGRMTRVWPAGGSRRMPG